MAIESPGESITGYAITVGGTPVPLRERTTIGRDPDCEISLPDDALVSRRHALLVVCAHGLVVEDLQSMNGVYVAGERISQSRLLVGCESIRVGNTDLVVSCISEERKQMLLGWDDETVRSRSVRAADAAPADVTTPADVFEVLTSLAEKALRTGDAEQAERIIGGHLQRLLTDAQSPAGADLARVERALKLALELAEAEGRLPPGERVRLRRVEGLARLLRTG